MAVPGETLGTPWPPLAIRPCKAGCQKRGKNDSEEIEDRSENVVIYEGESEDEDGGDGKTEDLTKMSDLKEIEVEENEVERPEKRRRKTKTHDCHDNHGRIARGGQGLPKVSPGPPMPPCPTLLCPYGRFRGGLPVGPAACGRLLPP
jgi:hypothetical protein